MTSETKGTSSQPLRFTATAQITIHFVSAPQPLSKNYMTVVITYNMGVFDMTLPLSQISDLQHHMSKTRTHEEALADFFTQHGGIYRSSPELGKIYQNYPSFRNRFKPPAPQPTPKRFTLEKKAAAMAAATEKDTGATIPVEAIPPKVLSESLPFGTPEFYGTQSQEQTQSQGTPLLGSPEADTLTRNRSGVEETKKALLTRSSSTGKGPMTRTKTRLLNATKVDRSPAESDDEEMETAATSSKKPAPASSNKPDAATDSSATAKPSAPAGGAGFFSHGAGAGSGSKASAQARPGTSPAAFFESDPEPAAKRQKTARGKSVAVGAGSGSSSTPSAPKGTSASVTLGKRKR